MEVDAFCLRWNNHQSNLVNMVQDLLGQFNDVTLLCEDRAIRAHKLVLSACSGYFRRLLISSPMDNQQHPFIFFKDVKAAEMTAVIRFMYEGQVDIQQQELDGVLKLARTLEVTALSEIKTATASEGNPLNKIVHANQIPQSSVATPVQLPTTARAPTITTSMSPLQHILPHAPITTTPVVVQKVPTAKQIPALSRSPCGVQSPRITTIPEAAMTSRKLETAAGNRKQKLQHQPMTDPLAITSSQSPKESSGSELSQGGQTTIPTRAVKIVPKTEDREASKVMKLLPKVEEEEEEEEVYPGEELEDEQDKNNSNKSDGSQSPHSNGLEEGGTGSSGAATPPQKKPRMILPLLTSPTASTTEINEADSSPPSGANDRSARRVVLRRRVPPCPHCGKEFSSPRALSRHVRTHEGFYLPCTECPKTFTRSDSLKRHLQRQHGQDISIANLNAMIQPR
ncbi:unnamed protein product [Cyprideis torosa]|uniref:Uncharacterized protein n=1 Tax=Cyprideis torosa TaxID=163714 RepID=A0A7R8W5E6_9CRUS|nr:unnamed protein product [Cyprideis torosa]CAG0879783.1 unnamed protein product [Cyprideis torosa]